MDSIIELPYVPLPKSGLVRELKPGKFTPRATMNIRSGPGKQYRELRRIAGGAAHMIGERVTVYPQQDVWLELNSGVEEYVALVTGDDIWGSVEGWGL